MKHRNLKIGILDSGKGGHYALLDIKSHFPQYEYESYFDHENAPYGNRTGEEIYALTEAGCLKLWEKGCQLILIACNTVSAETLRKLQERYSSPRAPLSTLSYKERGNANKPSFDTMKENTKKDETLKGAKKILGCIIPSVEVAVEISSGKIGLIGTRFTVESGKYEREIAKLSNTHTLFPLATPELASYVEDGISHHPDTLAYLDSYIGELLDKNIDTLILACTHYTVYYEYLTLKYPHLKIVDSARTQTIKLGEYLQKHPELFV